MSETVEISASGHDAAELCRKDLGFLGMLTNPEEFVLAFPPYYITLFYMLTACKQAVERFAVGLPRGFAKTTFIKLLCVWYILFSKKQFILIVGASEDLAVNTLSDICDLLDSGSIRKLFGNWKVRAAVDTQALKVMHFRGRNIILRAIGAGTAVRGINRKHKRPDVIIMDDVQKREISENKDLSEQLLKWLLGTLMKTRSNSGCTFIYIGNMYPQNCILDKLRKNKQWTSFVVGGILADGTSLWEELRPIQELLDEYESDAAMGHADIFISEVLNSTEISHISGLDLNKIPQLPEYYLDEEPDGSYILIDPSSGKKQGDDCSIGYFEVFDGKSVFTELAADTFTPLETIRTAIGIGLRTNTRLICVEDVAYQSTLLFWFNHVCTDEGITGFVFMPVSPKNQAKNTRIKRGLLQCIAGEQYLHPTVRSKVIAQAEDWNPLKTDNKDDIIDLLGYTDEILHEYPEFVVRTTFDVDAQAVSGAHSDTLQLPY